MPNKSLEEMLRQNNDSIAWNATYGPSPSPTPEQAARAKKIWDIYESDDFLKWALRAVRDPSAAAEEAAAEEDTWLEKQGKSSTIEAKIDLAGIALRMNNENAWEEIYGRKAPANLSTISKAAKTAFVGELRDKFMSDPPTKFSATAAPASAGSAASAAGGAGAAGVGLAPAASAAGSAGAAASNESNDSEYYVNDTHKKWSKRPGNSVYMNMSTGRTDVQPVNPKRLTDAMMETVDDSEYYLNAAGKHWSKEPGSTTYSNMNTGMPGSPTLPLKQLTDSDMGKAKERAEKYARQLFTYETLIRAGRTESLPPSPLDSTAQIYLRDATRPYDVQRESNAKLNAGKYESSMAAEEIRARSEKRPVQYPPLPDERVQKYLKPATRAKLGLPPLAASPNARRATRARKSTRRNRSRKVRK